MTQQRNEENPFGSGMGSGRRRVVAIAAAGGILIAATAAAMLLSRDDAVAAAPAGHDHAGAPAAASSSPVTLTPEQAHRIGVTYAVATMAPLGREIRTVGQVTFDETRVRTIAPKVEGWVERLYVNYTGQLVAAGQPLLAIYSPMLVSAQEELLLAARLVRDVEGGSEEARRSAADLLSSARRRLAYWDIPAGEIVAIERSGTVRRTLTLRAPYGGYVLEKNVLPGQKIAMGEALYRLADLRVIWIEGEVFEQDLPAVRLGQPVVVEVDAVPGREWRGRITYVYPTVDPDTRTARVRVELPNAGMALKPGMYATVRVDGVRSASVLTVPRSAVLSTGTRHLVFVQRGDGRLEPRDVAIGASDDQRIAIRSGLAAGEKVVASATFLVDAESNLGSLLGGMGGMPGMDMTAPVPGPADPATRSGTPAPPDTPVTPAAPGTPTTPAAPATPPPGPAGDPHAGHRM